MEACFIRLPLFLLHLHFGFVRKVICYVGASGPIVYCSEHCGIPGLQCGILADWCIDSGVIVTQEPSFVGGIHSHGWRLGHSLFPPNAASVILLHAPKYQERSECKMELGQDMKWDERRPVNR